MERSAGDIIDRALGGYRLDAGDGMWLLTEAPLNMLMAAAHALRMKLHPGNEVTWIIDRNVNISNVCHAGCLFCNFSCSESSGRAFITTMDDYHLKIEELFRIGGRQLLLQGGLHPKLGLDFYKDLFKKLKSDFPELELHALGPPEVVHLAKKEGISSGETLDELISSGLDSLPGAGAEILSDRVRKQLSPGKCSVAEWLEVMHEAHKRLLPTSATMMFGHIETNEERIEHLILLRDLQSQKPVDSEGFFSFIPWPFQEKDTVLNTKHMIHNTVSPFEYIKFFAVARLILNNISNLQPSWLTIGVPYAQICLHGGGNDFGSIMIEENVVSSAGAEHHMDEAGIKSAIREAGFVPVKRNQRFEYVNY